MSTKSAKTVRQRVVFSLGGSLIVPDDGIGVKFLRSFNTFIRQKLSQNPDIQFFIVAGGGAITRHYQKAAKHIIEEDLSPDDLDWLGIHATRLNAHLIRTIFRDIAHPVVLDNYEIIRKPVEPVVVGSGWRPGWSTDFCAAMVCEDYRVDTVINMSNIEMVFDKDPKIYPDATPIREISWKRYREISGNVWVPGMNVPFDPIAAKKAQELGLRVVILRGGDFDNLENYFQGKQFIGTVIQGE